MPDGQDQNDCRQSSRQNYRYQANGKAYRRQVPRNDRPIIRTKGQSNHLNQGKIRLLWFEFVLKATG